MVFCVNCGKTLIETAKFCDQCATPVVSANIGEVNDNTNNNDNIDNNTTNNKTTADDNRQLSAKEIEDMDPFADSDDDQNNTSAVPSQTQNQSSNPFQTSDSTPTLNTSEVTNTPSGVNNINTSPPVATIPSGVNNINTSPPVATIPSGVNNNNTSPPVATTPPTNNNTTPIESPVVIDTRRRLYAFYQIYNPSKLADTQHIEATLQHYRGREAQLFADLERKYINKNVNNAPKLPPRQDKTDNNNNNNKPLSKQMEKQLKKVPNVIDGIKRMYRTRIRPLEEKYGFQHCHSPLLTDTDFEAKPMVLLLGQYSVGKTTFIKYLLEREFPGIRVGPEPTTDRFVAVMHGFDERITPGNAVAVQADKPFTALQKYGMDFLNKFECVQCPAPILEKLSFIDTPGVLSGEKQRIGRSYDFPSIVEWFSERCDRILLLFDAHKLDISDEFKSVIEATRGHEDKIRVVLNKADKVSSQQLMRVYGALMWSLGKVMQTPEVLRVYIGSFWDQPYENKENITLFDAEAADLLADLRSLPRNSAIRKVNELVKRARMAKVHAYLCSYMRDQFGWWGKESTQKELLKGLKNVYRNVQSKYNLPKGDFPSLQRFHDYMKHQKIHKYPKLDERLIKNMEQVLAYDIPNLMTALPGYGKDNGIDDFTYGSILNPFDDTNKALRANASVSWEITHGQKSKYDNIFHTLEGASSGYVSGAKAANKFMESGLSKSILKKLWSLADIDRDGRMDASEFCVAMYLIDLCLAGNQLPDKLPITMVPPEKRFLLVK